MSDSTNPLDQVSQAALQREVLINELFAISVPPYGRKPSSAGLDWDYYGGRWGGFSVANGGTTLTDNTTTYMVVALASGAVSFSTSNTNWNNTATYARAYKLVAASGVVTWEDHREGPGGTGAGGAGGSTTTFPFSFVVAISDETTDITTGAAKVTFPWPYPGTSTLTAVYASLSDASSSGAPQFDINEGVTSILSTKITIDATETDSSTATTPPVISDASIAHRAAVSIDIDTAGTDAKGAKITFVGTWTP